MRKKVGTKNSKSTRHGLKLNLEKTVELEGKKLTLGDSFVYLEGAMWGDGKMERGMSKSTGRSERVESS